VAGDTSDVHYKMSKYASKVVRLKIVTLYKGKTSSDTLTIITPATGAACGLYFENGKDYIIYGMTEELSSSPKFKRTALNNNIYYTHTCTGTAMFTKAEEGEIDKLRSSQPD
jgi:hypothetical protein